VNFIHPEFCIALTIFDDFWLDFIAFCRCFSRPFLGIKGAAAWSRAEYQTLLNESISGRTRQKLIPLVLDDLAPEELPLLRRNLQHERYHDHAGYQRVLDRLHLR